MDNNLLPFLPMLYVAWSDAIIDQPEIEAIRQKMQEQDWLSADEKLVLNRWMDPARPPAPGQMQLWLKTIRDASADLDEAPRQSLAESPIYKGGNPISLLEEKYGLKAADIYKLGSNENPLPTPDSVKNAIHESLSGLNRYPPSIDDLKDSLSAYIGREMGSSNFVVGNGGCEVLDLIAKSFIDEGDEAIVCPPTFPLYRLTLFELSMLFLLLQQPKHICLILH